MNATLTLGGLRDRYLDWLGREILAGRNEPRTAEYYRRWLALFVEHAGRQRHEGPATADDLAALGAAVPVAELIPWDLESFKSGWHSVQAVQRLLNWSVEMGLVKESPFARVSRPDPGRRERTLDRPELARLLRSTTRAFRRFLVAMYRTLARPGELRSLKWEHLHESGRFFQLRTFKAKRKRKDRDGAGRVRQIALDGWMRRLVARLAQKPHAPGDFVFLNCRGDPWNRNSLRCAMRKARSRAGLDHAGGERVVCYTLRHSAATEATARGVADRRLADVLGHTTTRTTARYQHLGAEALVDAVEQATARHRSPGRQRA